MEIKKEPTYSSNKQLTEYRIDDSILTNFRFGKYRFTIEAQDDLHLPEYKGSTFRGAFGRSFKRICCDFNGQKIYTECHLCKHHEKCAYSQVFSTLLPKNSPFLRSLREIPRPYVIEPPLDRRREVPRGGQLSFNLILIGGAVDFFPYFYGLFKSIGEDPDKEFGLGSRRGKYRLTYITTVDMYNEDWNILYTPNRGLREAFISSDQISFADLIRLDNRQITSNLKLKILTPMDLRVERDVDGEKKNRLVDRLEFRFLIRSLLFLTSALSCFHCSGIKLKDSFAKTLGDYASHIRIIEDKTYIHTFLRERGMLGGFLGELYYEGNFEPFIPFLYLGEQIHAGKGRVFGLGKYQLEFVECSKSSRTPS